MRIGLDIDGVFADFNHTFIKAIVAITGEDRFPPRPFEIPTWNYPESYGYTAAQVDLVWRTLLADKTFWRGLSLYPGTIEILNSISGQALAHHDDIYFVTSRPGIASKYQTEKWLATAGLSITPTVLISSQKGAVCKALELDVYIDDRWENALDVAKTARWGDARDHRHTRSFLLARPWNREPWNHSLEPDAKRITKVDTVEEFLRTIGRAV